MPLINWNDSLSVGVDYIDNQHKQLVSIINRLNDAMLQDKGNDVMSQILDNLVDYTKSHFKSEEHLMRKYGYPESANHLKEHDKLTKEVIDFAENFKQGKAIITLPVLNFLKDWLNNHILKTDKLLGQFLSKDVEKDLDISE
jgi:hemerythrin